MLVALAVMVIAGAAPLIGIRRQRIAFGADRERLIRAAADLPQRAIGDELPADLPVPVARYLRLALPHRRHIQEVRMTQSGTLRTNASAEQWLPFTAEHLVVPQASGFLWNARVQVAPFVHVRVRDALIDGIGSGQVALMSALTVSAATGGVEMNSGSLHRYLAEAVWYPSALLPGPRLQWTPVDATKALATLTNDRTSVSLEFRFAESGEVTGIYTPERWGTFPGGYRQAPWEGRFHEYRKRDGMLVPTHGEVGWYIDGEWQAVWKGSVTAYRTRMR